MEDAIDQEWDEARKRGLLNLHTEPSPKTQEKFGQFEERIDALEKTIIKKVSWPSLIAGAVVIFGWFTGFMWAVYNKTEDINASIQNFYSMVAEQRAEQKILKQQIEDIREKQSLINNTLSEWKLK